jgi:hypothetical protein
MNLLSCMFLHKGFLINSEQLGPTNEEQIEYSVIVTAGKKIRFNVRDSVNLGYEGTAFTDVITISESLYRQDETEIQLREAIILVSKAVLLVPPLSLCKYSQCMSADMRPPTTLRGSGNTDAPPPSSGTSIPSSSSDILSSPLAEASAALSSQFSLSSSIASSTSTTRNGDAPVNANVPSAGFVLEISYVLVFGSLAGIIGAYFLTIWQSESHSVWA